MCAAGAFPARRGGGRWGWRCLRAPRAGSATGACPAGEGWRSPAPVEGSGGRRCRVPSSPEPCRARPVVSAGTIELGRGGEGLAGKGHLRAAPREWGPAGLPRDARFSRPLWEPALLRGLKRPDVVPAGEESVLSVTCGSAAVASCQSVRRLWGSWWPKVVRALVFGEALGWGGEMLLWVVGGYHFYDEQAALGAINVTKQAAEQTGSYCESSSQRV